MIRQVMIVGLMLVSLGTFAQAAVSGASAPGVPAEAGTTAYANSQPSTLHSPHEVYSALFLEAMVQRQKGNSDAAFDLLTRCVEIDSTASEAYFFLSYYYDQMRMHKQALACIRKAASIEPLVTQGGGGSDANIYNQKGIPSVVLGTGMTKVHTKEETIKVENLNKTAELCLELLTH